MKSETRSLIENVIVAIAKEIALEQDDGNNIDYKKEITNEYWLLFNNSFWDNELLPVIKAQCSNLGKRKPLNDYGQTKTWRNAQKKLDNYIHSQIK